MGLRTPRPALRAQKAAANLLKDLAASHVTALASTDGAMVVLPLRTIAVEDLEHGASAASWAIGWRAYWLGADAAVGATLDLLRTRGGRPCFSSYSWGEKAAAFAATLARAEAATADRSELFDVSILRLSALMAEGLWLRAPGARASRLFGLTPSLDDADFIAETIRLREAGVELAKATVTPPQATRT